MIFEPCPEQVFSLAAEGNRWVAACRQNGTAGLLLGMDTEVLGFLPAFTPDVTLTAVLAGTQHDPWLLTGTSARRSGVPMVALWKDATRHVTLLQGEEEPVTRIAADPSGRYVAAGDVRGRVWLWDRERRSHLVRDALHRVDARCLAASAAGRTAVATADGHVLVFGASFGGEPATDAVTPFAPTRLLFADEGRILLASDDDGRLAAIDVNGTAHAVSWPRELGAPREIAVAADAPILAALCANSTIAILRLTRSTLQPITTIDAGGPVIALALDPAGQRLYAAVGRLGLDAVSWRVDTPDEAPLEVAAITSGLPPVPIAFPGDDLVAIADGDDLLFVPTDAPDRAMRRGGHDEPIRRIAAGAGFVASLATSFQDTSVDQIRLWTADGQPLGPVTLPGRAADIALSPDGSALLALSDAGTLWRVTLRAEDWIDAARRIAGRSLDAEEERRYGVDAWRARSPESADQ